MGLFRTLKSRIPLPSRSPRPPQLPPASRLSSNETWPGVYQQCRFFFRARAGNSGITYAYLATHCVSLNGTTQFLLYSGEKRDNVDSPGATHGLRSLEGDALISYIWIESAHLYFRESWDYSEISPGGICEYSGLLNLSLPGAKPSLAERIENVAVWTRRGSSCLQSQLIIWVYVQMFFARCIFRTPSQRNTAQILTARSYFLRFATSYLLRLFDSTASPTFQKRHRPYRSALSEIIRRELDFYTSQNSQWLFLARPYWRSPVRLRLYQLSTRPGLSNFAFRRIVGRILDPSERQLTVRTVRQCLLMRLHSSLWIIC